MSTRATNKWTDQICVRLDEKIIWACPVMHILCDLHFIDWNSYLMSRKNPNMLGWLRWHGCRIKIWNNPPRTRVPAISKRPRKERCNWWAFWASDLPRKLVAVWCWESYRMWKTSLGAGVPSFLEVISASKKGQLCSYVNSLSTLNHAPKRERERALVVLDDRPIPFFPLHQIGERADPFFSVIKRNRTWCLSKQFLSSSKMNSSSGQKIGSDRDMNLHDIHYNFDFAINFSYVRNRNWFGPFRDTHKEMSRCAPGSSWLIGFYAIYRRPREKPDHVGTAHTSEGFL